MTILIDADGCPVVDITLETARRYAVPVILLCDSAHVFAREGAQTVTVSTGADSVDFALVNRVQPGDIVVTGAMEVHDGFNAIGSCVKKEYTYLIYNSPIKDPFYVNRAWFYPKHLDETVMQRAAQQFVGTHDFAAVRSVGTEVKSTVRTVYHYEVERDGDLISLRVCANGFLYNMARAMAGTVVYAAEGKFPPEEVVNILARGDRKAAGPTVPPGGLYMTQLWYDDGEAVFHVG